MENLNNILWITGIWGFIWVMLWMVGEIIIDISCFNTEEIKELGKFKNTLISIVIVFFYILQIIDYINLFN